MCVHPRDRLDYNHSVPLISSQEFCNTLLRKGSKFIASPGAFMMYLPSKLTACRAEHSRVDIEEFKDVQCAGVTHNMSCGLESRY